MSSPQCPNSDVKVWGGVCVGQRQQHNFLALPADAKQPTEGPPWDGREKPGDVGFPVMVGAP